MKRFLKALNKMFVENIYFILVLVITTFILNIDLPYYIYAPGGTIDINDNYQIEDAYDSKGTFNQIYVSSYDANVCVYLISLLLPSWDAVADNDVLYENENDNDLYKRDELYFIDGKQNAIINAYKMANEDYKIEDTHFYVIYKIEEIKSPIAIGDEIIKIDNEEINSYENLVDYINTKQIGDIVNVKVLRDEQEKVIKTTIIESKNNKVIGVLIMPVYDLKTDPKITFSYDDVLGSSGGLMLALSIYDSLIKKDLTRGYNIAGTGTLEFDGTVGEIGEVEKKLASAVKDKMDIFFVPAGNNAKDAKALAKKEAYNIRIVEVKTFEEAITYLNTLE